MAQERFQRKTRKLKHQIDLYVDGEVEREYFKKIMINRNDYVKFTIRNGDEIDFIRTIHDEIPSMVILDIDGITPRNDPKKRYGNLIKVSQMRKAKGRVFYNNYSFETFLLLHCCEFQKPISHPKQYDTFMNKYFDLHESWFDHKSVENRQKVMEKINQESVAQAIERARKMNTNPFDNPSTNMHCFFDRIQNIK